jgi:hypothetical protein
MAATMRAPLRQSEVQTLDLPLIGAVPEGQSPVKRTTGDWVLPLYAKAIDRTMQRKEAAILMGIDGAQLTRQLAGDGHLSALRLGAMPPAFWMAFMDVLREHYGIDDKRDRVRQATEMLSNAMAMLIAETQR